MIMIHHHYDDRSHVTTSPTCNLMTPGDLVTMPWPLEDYLDSDDDPETTGGPWLWTPERGGQRGRAEDLGILVTTWLMMMRRYVYLVCWTFSLLVTFYFIPDFCVTFFLSWGLARAVCWSDYLYIIDEQFLDFEILTWLWQVTLSSASWQLRSACRTVMGGNFSDLRCPLVVGHWLHCPDLWLVHQWYSLTCDQPSSDLDLWRH